MNKDQLFWTVLFLALSAVCGRLVFQQYRAGATAQAASGEGALDQLLAGRAYELMQTGKMLAWPEGMQVLGDLPGEDIGGYGVVLAVNDVSCDVCRDEQTQFLKSLAEAVAEPVLRVVVSADDVMYARSYMRMNGLAGPVYFDGDHRFFQENNLGSGPLLLLHHPSGEIMAAHYPIPGRPEASEPFHRMLRRFFSVPQPDETPAEQANARAAL